MCVRKLPNITALLNSLNLNYVNSVDAYNSVCMRALKSPTWVASSARRAGGGARTAEGWGSSRGQEAASAAC